MSLDRNDWRAARKTGLWVIGGIAGLYMVALLLNRGSRPPVDQVLIDACKDRYARAHSHGDTILADAWIPRPDLQGLRGLRRCSDLLVLGSNR